MTQSLYLADVILDDERFTCCR